VKFVLVPIQAILRCSIALSKSWKEHWCWYISYRLL